MSNSVNLFSEISVAIGMGNEHSISDCGVIGVSVVLNNSSCPKIIFSFKISVLEIARLFNF